MRQARRNFESIAEEAIDPHALADADDPFQATLDRCCLRYQPLLDRRAVLDLSRLQAKADALLQDHAVAQRVGAGVHHLMVDEYQDTGHVQERVPRRLAVATAV